MGTWETALVWKILPAGKNLQFLEQAIHQLGGYVDCFTPVITRASENCPVGAESIRPVVSSPVPPIGQHLQSAQPQGFAREHHPYTGADQIITQLSHDFMGIPSRARLPTRWGLHLTDHVSVCTGWGGSLASDCDPLCPKSPPPSQPSHLRVASPGMKESSSQTPRYPSTERDSR
eukprot:XP_017170363.1 PREDICTED: protein DBF4 homolog B [Mus musculus]